MASPFRSTQGAARPNWATRWGHRRCDFKTASEFCQAEQRSFLGEAEFQRSYGGNGNGANAYGKCVSANR